MSSKIDISRLSRGSFDGGSFRDWILECPIKIKKKTIYKKIKIVMKHLNIYEHFFYGREDGEDGEEVNPNQSSGFTNNSMGQLFMDRLPRGIKSELPRKVKDKLVSLNTSSLHVIDEEIQKLEFIVKKYNLDYHSDLIKFWHRVSVLPSSTEEQVVSFFKSMLDYALRITVFKDYNPIRRWHV